MTSADTSSDSSATPAAEPPTTPDAGAATNSLAGWLREGLRTAVLRPPTWQGLSARPATILGLMALLLVVAAGLQRLWVDGPATVNWTHLLAGWATTAATVWVCYALVPSDRERNATEAPSAAHLFTLLLAQGGILSVAYGLFWIAVLRSGDGFAGLSPALLWGAWIALWLWLGTAQAVVLWRSTRRKARAAALAALLVAVGLADSAGRQSVLWVPEQPATAETGAPEPLALTQELLERQSQLLGEQLAALPPQRPGVVDLYVLTFAPYAHEDVFLRESRMVAEVMRTRFDSEGRTLMLANHAETTGELPWATPLNLQRALRRIGELIDRDEDIVFLHLTSHGARDGELAAQFWPLRLDALTPGRLATWLDEAGIRHRVVSISACYSGSWIDPLRGDGTLVMTAADADHTSFGCGRGSPLTYFGRAMYDEQLRTQTRSFEAAHAAARPLIEQREQEAGKDDGYSNPQLAAGESIRRQLERLRQRLDGHAG